MLIISKSGRILYGNRRAFIVSGYAEDELVGMSIKDLLTGQSLLKGVRSLTQELLGLAQEGIILDFLTKSGEIRTLEFSPGSEMVSAGGKTIGVLVTARDVTE